MINRKADWLARLFAAIAERRAEPFKFGTHDCCMATAFIVQEMTGSDIMKGFRGYGTELGAIKKLKRLGYGSLLQTLINELPKRGFKRIPRSHASMGDILVTDQVEDSTAQAIGICMGAVGYFPTDIGWAQVPVNKCTKTAFKVG